MEQELRIQEKAELLQQHKYYKLELKQQNTENKQIQLIQTIHCKHIQPSGTLTQALDQFKNFQSFTCNDCQKVANNVNELVKDIRWMAADQFHELTQDVLILNGRFYPSINRGNKYEEVLRKVNEQNQQLIQGLYDRYQEKEGSVSSFILADNNRKDRYQKVSFLALCLQDRVPICIPVRILGCQHKECYELTSLLFYQSNLSKQQNQQQEGASFSSQLEIDDEDFIYKCQMPNCQSKLDMSSVESLFAGIGIDSELLEALKESNPAYFKFSFSSESFKLENVVLRYNSIVYDPVIFKYYQQISNETQDSDIYQNFEKSVLKVVVTILRQGQKNYQEKLRQLRFQDVEINVQDKFTGYAVEFPVRCIKCPASLVTDVRSYISDFFNYQNKKPVQKYRCPLCGYESKKNSQIMSLIDFIYLDTNLQFRMFQNMKYLYTKQIFYNGREYMKQEFQQVQKYETSSYIKQLKKKTNSNLIVNYKLKCSLNKNKNLRFPLSLKKCQKQNYIDFESFYEKLQEIQFDLKKGLILCQCESCNQNKITQLQGNIYYNEAFAKALDIFYSSKQQNNLEVFQFDFEKWQVVVSEKGNNEVDFIGQVGTKDGFVDLLNDNEYKEHFKEKKFGGKYYFKLDKMHTQQAGVTVEYSDKGIKTDISSSMNERNQQLQNQDCFKKWGFQITSMEIKCQDSILNQFKGGAKSQQM